MIRRNVLTQPSGTNTKMEAAHIFYDQQVGTRGSPRKVTECTRNVGRRAHFLLLRLQLYKLGSLFCGSSELISQIPNLGMIMGLLGPKSGPLQGLYLHRTTQKPTKLGHDSRTHYFGVRTVLRFVYRVK
jgi:hypothetical protein